MLGKKLSEKTAKNVFYIFTQISLPKNKGGKNARNNFSRNTRIVRAKNDGGKNRRKKVRKTFLYIHTNIVTKKWVEKKRETNFPETHK